MEGHFVLCGLGRIGSRVLNYLAAAGARTIVVDTQPVAAMQVPPGTIIIQGDCRKTEVLREAGVEQARGILILTSEDLVNLSAALLARQLNPTARIVVRMFNPGLIPRLGEAAVNIAALSTSTLTAPVLALIARTGGALGTFTANGQPWRVTEVIVEANSTFDGMTLQEMAGRRGLRLIGHARSRQTYQFNQHVDPEARLAAGDHVIVCGQTADVARLEHGGTEETPPELLWAGTVQRHLRVLGRLLADVNVPVKICTAILVVVVVTSILVFSISMGDPIPRAFYRTISLMATTSDMGLREIHPEGWQRLYVGALRLAGAVLVAAFTAIFTNYLVRAQLQGALEVRRIPECGHIVVCGLGNVGYRVVVALLAEEENVVAIERSLQNPFIATVRRQKVPVIVGDAAVHEVLKAAHAGTARAVVAATDNDLANVEVALLVRQLNPTQRVVLRLTDTQLAATMREAANIRLALSIPDLAALAFVAALFGDRVQTVFFVQGHLLAVVDLRVADDRSRLHGLSVRRLAEEYNLQPVTLVRAEGKSHDDPLSTELAPGDRLTVIVDLIDLQRLMQRGG
jgi:Trk K+ transport system NAD-binding subunit